MAVDYGSLSFQQQIDFFRQKVNLPTQAWTDLWHGMHARAFVVAGATRDELLTDLRGAVDKAISQGTTLAEFRKDFDALVAHHGWTYNGGRNWRTRVIYETNLRTSYMAGRYQQMQAVKRTRPYWRYRHNDSVAHPRPQHLAWDGIVLAADDPWWDTHFTPNGWGCRCYIETLSERDLQRLGKSGPDTAPALDMQPVTVGARGPSPRTVEVPAGIDPGWAYNVGQAAWGKPLSQQTMAAWKAQGGKAWTSLTPGTARTYDRPARIPFDTPTTALSKRLKTQAAVADELTQLIGGPEQVFKTPAGLPVLVDAQALAAHIDPKRSEYLALITDTIKNPFEQWLAFERHEGTGQVVLRSRVLKAFQLDKRRGVIVVCNAVKGMLEAWTLIPTSDQRYLERQRRGLLLYGR